MALDFSSLEIASLRHLSDEDVLAALQEGRVQALNILYQRYAQRIYSLSYRILNSAEEAEDVTQEVFLTLVQRDTYQRSRGTLKAYLTTLTRSRAIDKLRSKGSRDRFLQRWQRLSESEQETSPPLEAIALSEQSHRLHEALAALSDSEREILEIAYYEGCSQSEIAKRLNLSIGTVKTRSRQGLIKLRQHLETSR
ncbi:MAG: sigma-70 family RNA polymerase sigma factor [Synechococcales cyanobacterium M58_A2018_015]|nr:sigma-70 family RNA polymerase sigma factor [Synechococcales cyanobacterium M58_A2018_015]